MMLLSALPRCRCGRRRASDRTRRARQNPRHVAARFFAAAVLVRRHAAAGVAAAAASAPLMLICLSCRFTLKHAAQRRGKDANQQKEGAAGNVRPAGMQNSATDHGRVPPSPASGCAQRGVFGAAAAALLVFRCASPLGHAAAFANRARTSLVRNESQKNRMLIEEAARQVCAAGMRRCGGGVLRDAPTVSTVQSVLMNERRVKIQRAMQVPNALPRTTLCRDFRE